MRVDEITPDSLANVDAEQAHVALNEILRASVVAAGEHFRAHRQQLQELEVDCMLRARRLFELDFDKREIQELFGVDRRTINRWLKGMD